MDIVFGYIEVLEKDPIPRSIWSKSLEPTLKNFFNVSVSNVIQKQREYIATLNPREIDKHNISRRRRDWDIFDSSQGNQSHIGISDDDQFPYNRTFLLSRIPQPSISRTALNAISLVDSPHGRFVLSLYQLAEILASEYIGIKAWGFYDRVVPFTSFTGTEPSILDFLPSLPPKIQANFVKNTFIGESEG